MAKLWSRCGHATGATLSDVRAAEATEAIAVEVFRQCERSGQLVSMTVINRALNQLRAHRPTCKCRLCGETLAKARADRVYRVAARWQDNGSGRPDSAGLEDYGQIPAVVVLMPSCADYAPEPTGWTNPTHSSHRRVPRLPLRRLPFRESSQTQTDFNACRYPPTIDTAASSSTSTARFSSIPPRRFTAGDNRSSLIPCWIDAQA